MVRALDAARRGSRAVPGNASRVSWGGYPGIARLAALATAFKEAVTMSLSMPTP